MVALQPLLPPPPSRWTVQPRLLPGPRLHLHLLAQLP